VHGTVYLSASKDMTPIACMIQKLAKLRSLETSSLMKPSLSGERVEGDSSDADFQVSTDDHEVSELV
jgi:hypothetical protein